MQTKQIIVVRTKYADGKGGTRSIRTGKLIAQACHASLAFLTRQLQGVSPVQTRVFTSEPVYHVHLSPAAKAWIDSSFAKVCLQVDSEQELLDIEAKAKEAGLEVHLITDSGLTEFGGVPTKTCLAIGPDEVEKIDKITGHLKLY